MRKIEFSSKTMCSTRFNQRADCRSRPNGFSTISLAPAAPPDCSSPCTTGSNIDGGTAR